MRDDFWYTSEIPVFSLNCLPRLEIEVGIIGRALVDYSAVTGAAVSNVYYNLSFCFTVWKVPEVTGLNNHRGNCFIWPC